MWFCCVAISSFYVKNRKTIGANCLCALFLLVYVFIGAFVFLHLENRGDSRRLNQTYQAQICIQNLLKNKSSPDEDSSLLASHLTSECVPEREYTPHEVSWSLKTAALYSFGILTTLGYGKIEPESINGRIFTVLYGFVGIPVTVIIFTNFGRYLQRLETIVRIRISRSEGKELEMEPSISSVTLCCMVWSYLIVGALFIPYLKGRFDFFNGIYFAFLCFTAIEYGELIPDNDMYLPIVIAYICVGLAISTIAFDIGSAYVRRLFYVGKRLRNIANVNIWFGSRSLRVKDLILALGQNIGLESTFLGDIDLEQLVQAAIKVKEGKLAAVPQFYYMDGIWPPELVPLFMKEGYVPMFADEHEENDLKKKDSVISFDVRNGKTEGSLYGVGEI
ncbi:hypothetical protein L596_008516 [Steinernema carpocapsae]|uniref:Potassium channel domain-containing protein n=1 Tax=Steinernema carpocapsae TaxID=34508 RepID=A0A4U5PD90_STECR|nr:hypothetical protein L596_008516 [Steinernema carpocapsae]